MYVGHFSLVLYSSAAVGDFAKSELILWEVIIYIKVLVSIIV